MIYYKQMPAHITDSLTKNHVLAILPMKFDVEKTNCRWLSGIVINMLTVRMVRLRQALRPESYTIYAASSLAFSNYYTANTGQKSKFKRTCDKNDEFMSARIIILPANVNAKHWVLYIIDRSNKTITFIDPFGTNDRYNPYLGKLFSRKDNTQYTPEFPIHTRQMDVFNCGVYILMFIWAFLHGKSYTCFDAKDLGGCRMLIAKHIFAEIQYCKRWRPPRKV